MLTLPAQSLRLRLALRHCAVLLATMPVLACVATDPAGLVSGGNHNWSRYLAGEDIRASCISGAGEHLRVVLNARHRNLVRSYDVQADAGQMSVDVEDFLASGDGGQGAGQRLHLTGALYATLVDRLQRTGAIRAPPRTAEPPAGGFYWLVSGCHNGDYFRSFYDYPADRFGET